MNMQLVYLYPQINGFCPDDKGGDCKNMILSLDKNHILFEVLQDSAWSLNAVRTQQNHEEKESSYFP